MSVDRWARRPGESQADWEARWHQQMAEDRARREADPRYCRDDPMDPVVEPPDLGDLADAADAMMEGD